ADEQMMISYTFRNYEIGNAAVKRISANISSGMHLARARPSKTVLVVFGDVNFAVGKLNITEQTARASSEATETSKASARKRHGARKRMVEIEGSGATHFCAETLVGSTIDRCFCSITPSQMIQLAVTSTTYSTPELLSRRRVSYHAAVLVSFAMRDLKAEKIQPIAQCIFKSGPAPSSAMVRTNDKPPLIWLDSEGAFPMPKPSPSPKLCAARSSFGARLAKGLARTDAQTAIGTVTGPTERLQKLADRWQPVFQGKTVDTGAAELYLNRCAPKVDLNSYAPPDNDALRGFARRSSFTPPGMDGPPYIARSAHEACTETLLQVTTWMLGGGFPPTKQTRRPRHPFQKGKHLTTLSTSAATVTRLNFVTLGFAGQAFPSFAHQFIRLALKAIGAPVVALNFFDLMCHNILAMAPCAGLYAQLFYIRSGIIQGCGWSGTLCAMGAACVLRDLEQQLELKGYGLRRACADDLGLALAAVARLAHLEGVMALVEDLAGLALKPAKCHIIPLAGPVDHEPVSMLRDSLVAIAPRFQEFNNCDNLTYLGLLLGPGATESLLNAKGSRNSASAVKDWPRLQDRGVHAPRSTQLAMIVAMVRAATSTLHKFPEFRKRLHQGFCQYGEGQTTLGVARAAQHLSPPWWKTPPFVETFHPIASAETDHRYYPPALPAPASRSALGADEVGTFLAKRLTTELPDLVNTFENDSEVFDRRTIAMKRLPPSRAAARIRTLSFSWLTSSRISYECGRRRCIFQCAVGADSEKHYVTCAPLAAAVAAATRVAAQTEAVANRALLDTSIDNTGRVVIACGTYHMLRIENSVDAETLRSAAR
ncbi:unnamed protein product, partial [Prorocentrum cordatum]